MLEEANLLRRQLPGVELIDEQGQTDCSEWSCLFLPYPPSILSTQVAHLPFDFVETGHRVQRLLGQPAFVRHMQVENVRRAWAMQPISVSITGNRYKKPEDLMGENGLFKQLTKMLVERALEAEMTEHSTDEAVSRPFYRR